MTEPVNDPASVSATDGLLGWTLSFLRPYRGRVALLAVLLLAEIGARRARSRGRSQSSSTTCSAAQPLPALVAAVDSGRSPAAIAFALLVVVVVAGVVLQLVNQLVSAYGTQVQVDTGQRMVYDLRCRLFAHLQALGLHHHITTSTATPSTASTSTPTRSRTW